MPNDKLKWEDVDWLNKQDLLSELKDLIENAKEKAEVFPSEASSWLYFADVIEAAISKLEETNTK